MNIQPRILCHFSCGAASAVATKLALDKYGADNCEIINIHIAEEHPDNQRFLKDCERWFGKTITIAQNDKYNASIYEVFRQVSYIKGIAGAPCTTQLKRKVRAKFSKPDDIHIFGFTVEEEQRAVDFEERNPQMHIDWTLIEHGLTKSDCLALLQEANIELPMMYQLGYRNNNCIGCVKGGMGYWNKIRKDFPDVFARMSMVEHEIGHAILKDNGKALFLDELPENKGRMQDEPDIECSFFCQMVKHKV